MDQAPPGWYADPAAPHLLRWWDGFRWTEHLEPAPNAGAPRPTTPDGEPLAGWWWRALAYFLDALIAGVVVAVVTLPSQIAVQRELNDLQTEFERELDAGEPAAFSAYFSDVWAVYADHVVGLVLLPLLLTLAYHALFLRWKGATPGKLVCGLRVRRRSEPGRLPWAVIAVRLLAQFAVPSALSALLVLSGSFAMFFVGWLVLTAYLLTDILWALGKRKQALHDVFAGTNVVRTR
jgi:uncharacterized RDD family membrane protein YckC